MLLDLHLSKIPNSISTLVGIWFIPRITENLLEMKHYCANLHTACCLFTTANCKLRPYQFDALFLGQTRAENRPMWSAWKLINKRCGLANREYHQSTDSQLTVRSYQVNYFVSQIRRVCFSKNIYILINIPDTIIRQSTLGLLPAISSRIIKTVLESLLVQVFTTKMIAELCMLCIYMQGP